MATEKYQAAIVALEELAAELGDSIDYPLSAHDALLLSGVQLSVMRLKKKGREE